MTCQCCGQVSKFMFPVLSRDNGFVDDLEIVCTECAELINDEYYCGAFRSLVPFELLSIERVSGLLVA